MTGYSNILEISGFVLMGSFSFFFFLNDNIRLHYTFSSSEKKSGTVASIGCWSWFYPNTHHYRTDGERSVFVDLRNSSCRKNRIYLPFQYEYYEDVVIVPE